MNEFLETSITAHNGSRILGFSTDEPGNFEGFHNEHLLMIADEAKSIPDEIFQAIERCQPERTLLLSSPGAPAGTFFEAFHRHRKHYRQHSVTAFDCPHLKPAWIDAQIEKHGRDSAFVRSMIFAEFSEGDELGTILRDCVKSHLASLRSMILEAWARIIASLEEGLVS